jgi:hypothetical protein
MKYLLLLLLFLSCSTSHKQEQTSFIFWDILEGYNSSWDKEQIISKLGNPQEVIKQKGEDLWIYRSPKTNFQSWAIGMTTENKISGIAYFPTSSGKSMYIFEVEERWKSRNCVHKKETKLIADNFQTTRTLECDNGKKVAEYNKYNEVAGISVK